MDDPIKVSVDVTLDGQEAFDRVLGVPGARIEQMEFKGPDGKFHLLERGEGGHPVFRRLDPVRLMPDGSPCWCVSDDEWHEGWVHAPVCLARREP